ncbi:hypothetical protein SISSUDRAFT_1052229 [Sistotremastrum suecicum HHB10207 ss-3]|uniref:Uncharacterized protein n=1 Tax=Sistotremastrum suecicum HHB10207 ss-3 TaxID=1314776 RepID=A0A166A1H4_9AGAM|nr:hypothetical protein SISSUDRAFT_1052229 [Sistotremastrum suecicum HHB10207 ss-3]
MAGLRCIDVLQVRLGLAAAFYGILFMLAATTIWTFIIRYRRHPSFGLLLSMLILTFSLATIQFALTVVNIASSVNSAVESGLSFSCVDRPASLAADLIFEIQMILGDSFAIYRCWLLWGRSWLVIAIPTLCTLSLIAFIPVLCLGLLPGLELPLSGIISLVTNMLVTLLILIKLWRSYRRVMPEDMILFRSVVSFIIQTGVMYHMTIFSLLLALFNGWANGFPTVGPNIITTIVAISFHLLILQVSLSRSFHTSSDNLSSTITPPKSTPPYDQEVELVSSLAKPKGIVDFVGQLRSRRGQTSQAASYSSPDPIVDLILPRVPRH